MHKEVLKEVHGPEIIQLTKESEENYVSFLFVILIWAYFGKKENALEYLGLKLVAKTRVRGSRLV
jgi:hypothetical protein